MQINFGNGNISVTLVSQSTRGAVDFIFMLTRRTGRSPNCLTARSTNRSLGLRHIGFKDVGVAPPILRRSRAESGVPGATATWRWSAPRRRPACVRRLDRPRHRRRPAAGRDGRRRRSCGPSPERDIALLSLSRAFPKGIRPQLGGTPAGSRGALPPFVAQGCAGVDLLAYRATAADPLDLVCAARRALGPDGS